MKRAQLKSTNVMFRDYWSSYTASNPSCNSEEASKDDDDEALVETCSICVRPIPNYVLRYSSGLLSNPACSDCEDTEYDDTEEETLAKSMKEK